MAGAAKDTENSAIELVLDHDLHWLEKLHTWKLPLPPGVTIEEVALFVSHRAANDTEFRLEGQRLRWLGPDTIKKNTHVFATVRVKPTPGRHNMLEFWRHVLVASIGILPATIGSLVLFWPSSSLDEMTLQQVVEAARSASEVTIVQGGEERIFPAVKESVRSAKDSIDIISGPALRDRANLPNTKQFLGEVIEYAKSRGVRLRRLFWEPDQLAMARAWSDDVGQSPYIEMRYLNIEDLTQLPTMPCVIIDGAAPLKADTLPRVHFGFGSLSNEVDVSLDNRKLAAIFEAYFTKLWEDPRAIVIKASGAAVDVEAIERAKVERLTDGVRELGRRSDGQNFLLCDVIADYDQFKKVILTEIQRTKNRWFISRIQDNQTSPEQEGPYFEQYQKRLEGLTLSDVRRLVTVPTGEHLAQYSKLIEQFVECSVFTMKVWTAKLPPTTFELLIGDEVVIIAFGPGSSVGPPHWGLRFRGREIADSFAAYYEHLWRHTDSVDVKGRGPLDEAGKMRAVEVLRQNLRR